MAEIQEYLCGFSGNSCYPSNLEDMLYKFGRHFSENGIWARCIHMFSPQPFRLFAGYPHELRNYNDPRSYNPRAMRYAPYDASRVRHKTMRTLIKFCADQKVKIAGDISSSKDKNKRKRTEPIQTFSKKSRKSTSPSARVDVFPRIKVDLRN